MAPGCDSGSDNTLGLTHHVVALSFHRVIQASERRGVQPFVQEDVKQVLPILERAVLIVRMLIVCCL